METPSLETMRALVQRVVSLQRAGQKVLLLSLSGLGRSGTAAACVLKQLGLPLEGLSAARGDKRVIESEQQAAFVSHFQ